MKPGNNQQAGWPVLVMAAGRGPNDPMAQHYGVSHKCLVEIAGKPMLERVIETLLASRHVGQVGVSIENEAVLRQGLGRLAAALDDGRATFCPSGQSAPASAIAGLDVLGCDKVLITTADHVLLNDEMIATVIDGAEQSGADLAVGLARDAIILKAYPDAMRTFIRLGPDRVSGCNLFACRTGKARRVLDFWQHVERSRKNPLKLAGAFGLRALFSYVSGRTNLQHGFALASKRIGAQIVPVLIDDANAAVDVDKPVDKDLVEQILAGAKLSEADE